MAYATEVYVKNSLICSIRQLAMALELVVYFEELDEIAYGDLVALRDNLLDQYNDKFFVAHALQDMGYTD
jgi:hypothetical protein